MPSEPIAELQGKPVVQVGIVVRDVVRTAKLYAKLFGAGPWHFTDIEPTGILLHDQALGDVDACVRIATANLGKIQIELLQPMYGSSTHMEFLNRHGQGVHHLSFGSIDGHDKAVEKFANAGIGIEMQGLIGGAITFTYLATQKQLGTIIEVVKPTLPDTPRDLKPWGKWQVDQPGTIDLEGKRIVQVGIVVEDVEQIARQYWELLSVGPWHFLHFQPPHLADCRLHGVPVRDSDFGVKAAVANLGDLQIELLEPTHGVSTHLEFLNAHGAGVHHVSFGGVRDHDEILMSLAEQGVEPESSGVLGGASVFTYLATQDALGTIWELGKAIPGKKSSLKPYGSYP
jgi:hypothetical protein